MKLLLVCAGGMSTSILMKKLEKHAIEKGIEFEVAAKGLGGYEEVCENYDLILLGPQVSYKKGEIQGNTSKPVGVIAQMDYALGNAENVFKLIEEIYSAK